jgi:subtilisin-like proprotein convertase family protein
MSLVWLLVLLLGALIAPRAHAQTVTVSTLAGGWFNDGTSTAAKFRKPYGLAVAADGTTYVADSDNHRIRKITSAGVVTTLAGSGIAGYAEGTGTAASFNQPWGVAVDTAGNVYVADTGNKRIRKITSVGVVTTLAGSGNADFADGTGTAASFNSPLGVGGDAGGNVYVGDNSNNRIRKITSAGVVTTLAGSGTGGYADGTGSAAKFSGPRGVAVDAAGNVYVAEYGNNRIRKITSAGVVTTLAGSGSYSYADGNGTAASFFAPMSVAVDAAGNVYVADSASQRIRKVTSAGVVTTLAGSGTAGYVDGTGTAASFNYPWGVAVDTTGNVYVADSSNSRIRKISSSGVVTTFAGSGTSADGTGTAASFNAPNGVAVDLAGNVYVADSDNNRIRKITSGGVVTTLAGSGSASYADGTGTAASFYNPSGVAVDAVGNVYVGDSNNHRIRKITSAGVVTTLAGSGTGGYADGTGSAAKFSGPRGVAVDAAGNVYVGDSNNQRIRKITSAGVVTTLAGPGPGGGYADGTGAAASFGRLSGVAVDAAGNVYVADDPRIRKITSAGVVTTLAGDATGGSKFVDGTGTAARFDGSYGVAVDAAGNVYVADSNNNRIRKITSAGVVTTLSGSGSAGNVDGTGTGASFSKPYGVAVDPEGKVYVADKDNATIRLITPPAITPAFTNTALSPTLTTGSSFSATLTASGYPAPTFSVQSGTLPAGLSLNTTTGEISGTPTTAGTFTGVFAATNSGGTSTQAFTFTVTQLTQTITFGPLAAKTYGDAPFTVSATASSGLTPTYSIVSGPATISGSTVTLTGAGTVVVRASQAGNASYAAATPVDRSFTVSLPVAYVSSFANSSSIAIPDAAITPSTSSIQVSGLNGTITKVAVTLHGFSHTWTRDVAILLVGPGGYKSILTGMVGVDGEGTNGTTANNVTLTFDQAASTSFLAIQTGNVTNLLSGTYEPAISPLEVSEFSFLDHVGDYVSSEADLNIFNGEGANGQWMLYVQDFAGGDSGTIAGGWTLAITTDAAADPALIEFVTISKDIDYVQTGADSSTVVVDPRPLGPTDGGPYGFAVNVQGSNLAGIAAPTVTGPFNLNQSNGPSTFSHNGGTLGYDADDQSWRYGATNFNDWGTTSKSANDTYFPNGTYTVQVLGTPVALNLTGDAYPNTPMVTLTGGNWVNGAYEVVVGQQLGITSNTFSAYATHANDVITLDLGDTTLVEAFASESPTTNSVSHTVDTSSWTSGSSYDLDLGFYAVVNQSIALPGAYSGAIYGKELRVAIRAVAVASPTAQTITFDPLANKTFGDAPFTVSASASSGLAPTYSIVSGPATISGSTVTLTGTGTVVVRASQAGNANYAAATPVDRSFTVAPSLTVPAFTSTDLSATLTTGTSYSATLTGSGNPAPTFSVQSGTLPAGLTFNTTSGAVSGTPTTEGTFTGVFAATNSQGTVTQAFTFTVAAPVPVPALPPAVSSGPGWRSAR